MTKESSTSRRTFTFVPTNFINAGSTIRARVAGTFVHFELTALAFETINTNTIITPICILTRSMVLARIVQRTLVNILTTVLSLPVGWTITSIGIYSVNTNTTMLTKLSYTIVYILLTITTSETTGTGTVVLIIAHCGTDPVVVARIGVAGYVDGVTIGPSIALFAVTLVSPIGVNTLSMLTWVAVVITLINIDVTIRSIISRFAGTPVTVPHGGALSPIPTGFVGTVVWLGTVPTLPPKGTGTGVGVQGGEMAGSSISTGAGVTYITHRGLTQGVGISNWTSTSK